jgi:hypothetical protein
LSQLRHRGLIDNYTEIAPDIQIICCRSGFTPRFRQAIAA